MRPTLWGGGGGVRGPPQCDTWLHVMKVTVVTVATFTRRGSGCVCACRSCRSKVHVGMRQTGQAPPYTRRLLLLVLVLLVLLYVHVHVWVAATCTSVPREFRGENLEILRRILRHNIANSAAILHNIQHSAEILQKFCSNYEGQR